jgi:YfiH family protein
VAAFTERTGGISEPPYDSLNLSFVAGDLPARVRTNRRRAAAAAAVPHLTLARQVHGVAVARIGRRRAGSGFLDPATALGPADVLVTRAPGVAVAILVADCLPIVLAADDMVMLLHAGWRGLSAGILGRAVSLFGRPERVAGAIGPGIGPCHYEVGPEVVEAVGRGVGGASHVRRRGRLFLDLPTTAEAGLRSAGVRDLVVAEECTACHPDRLYSHRRDGITGRQGAVAMLL